jgi:hypothetical protein
MGPIKLIGAFIPDSTAKCTNPAVDPEWFFDEQLPILAKAVCETCPLKQACLNWAIKSGEPYGIYGGLTPEERKKLTKNKVSSKQEAK